VIGTTGAIMDSSRQLPLDDACPSLLSVLRRDYRLAEAGVICSPPDVRLSRAELMALMVTGWWWAKRCGATYFVTSCAPHHSALYRAAGGMDVLLKDARYPKMRDAPLEILGAPMEEMLQHKRASRLLAKHQPPDDLLDSRLCAEVTL